MTVFRYKPITNSANFGGRRPYSAIKFIVLHYTGNTAKGANAQRNRDYFNSTGNRYNASAHYIVDDISIIQAVGDSYVAYAVGGNQGYGVALNGCTNYNSISIEMCVNSDCDFNEMYKNTVGLVQALKKKYPNATICRHYDATKKMCPNFFVNSYAKYKKFLDDVKGPVYRLVNLDKDSDIVLLDKPQSKPAPAPSLPTDYVLYKGDADKPIADLVAWGYRTKAYKLGTVKADESKCKMVGGEAGNRLESAVLALKKYFPDTFKKYINIAKLNSKMDYTDTRKPLLIVYYGDGDKPIADLLAWKYKCDTVLDEPAENEQPKEDTNFVLYVGRGANRLESAFNALAKYLPDEYLKVAGIKPDEIKLSPDKETVVLYKNEADKGVADLVAWEFQLKAVQETEDFNREDYHVIEIKPGHDRIDTALYNLAKYCGERFRKYM